jgi:hypothetical protein
MAQWNPYQPPEDGLPPQEIRFKELRAEPWPESDRRVRIHLEILPFLERPNIEVLILNQEEEEVASIHIIETIDARMTFTMHIRGEESAGGKYTLKGNLFYPEIGIVDQKSMQFETHQDPSG